MPSAARPAEPVSRFNASRRVTRTGLQKSGLVLPTSRRNTPLDTNRNVLVWVGANHFLGGMVTSIQQRDRRESRRCRRASPRLRDRAQRPKACGAFRTRVDRGSERGRLLQTAAARAGWPANRSHAVLRGRPPIGECLWFHVAGASILGVHTGTSGPVRPTGPGGGLGTTRRHVFRPHTPRWRRVVTDGGYRVSGLHWSFRLDHAGLTSVGGPVMTAARSTSAAS